MHVRDITINVKSEFYLQLFVVLLVCRTEWILFFLNNLANLAPEPITHNGLAASVCLAFYERQTAYESVVIDWLWLRDVVRQRGF